ncbi:MAG: HEAT repeat domain-containing protein [Planctomycetota bacterium]
MAETRPNRRLTFVGGVMIAGTLCAVAFCYLRPFDLYLLKSWESELATISDEEVDVHLEQIAALGERGLPTLVAALHSQRRIVAETAVSVLLRKLGELELRSTEESSRIVAELAGELAAHSDQPGPYSGPGTYRLATRLLLWPIDRKLIDGERLVADCELIIRSAKRSPHDAVAEPADEQVDAQHSLASRQLELGPAERPTQVAGGGLPVQSTDAPPLPPQAVPILNPPATATTSEPPQFIAVQSPRALAPVPSLAADETAANPATKPLAVEPQQALESRREAGSAPSGATDRPDLRAMPDLGVMQKLAGADELLARDAVDELYRRGFQTKHFRLAELLVDPDPNVRLQLVQSLPQMSGIDSRPWLLWLSRDEAPAVRKAAVAVIATSADPALQQRLRELESEETDDAVLRVVRQVLHTGQTTTLR